MSNKDIYQKEIAIKHCLSQMIIPFLEVDVSNDKELTDTNMVITDIDVLGLNFHKGQLLKTIFDCKTNNKTSPINRAFWASGLLNYTGCDEAYVILKKMAPEAHRLSARNLSVYLYSEGQFKSYSESLSIGFELNNYYSSNIENWQALSASFEDEPSLQKLKKIVLSDVAIESDKTKVFRRLLSACMSSRGKLNPRNPSHNSVYASTVLAFAICLHPMVNELKHIIDYEETDSRKLETLLRYYIWGGRDNYRARHKMKSYIAEKNETLSENLEIQAWEKFLELIRSLMDSPKDVGSCALVLREISIMSLLDSPDIRINQNIKKNFISNRTRQFISLISDYVIKASNIPIEFSDNLRLQIGVIID